MTEDFVDEAIRQCKAERRVHAIAHLWRQGLLTEEVWARLAAGLAINGGRKPSEYTALDQARRERFIEEWRATCRARKVKGEEAKLRIADELARETRYATFPSGKPFLPTTATGLARKNHPGSVRKRLSR
jgi:hypothetical protein